jgi:hypothetical protein
MLPAKSEQVFLIFFFVWVAFGVASAAFFRRNTNLRLKRKFWTPVNIAAGVLFLCFLWVMEVPGEVVMYWALPVVALITAANIYSTQFCNSCGKTFRNHDNIFSKTEFCSSCAGKNS